MPKRILLLGTTGVDKKTAVRNFMEYRRQRTDISNLAAIDFENRFIGKDL